MHNPWDSLTFKPLAIPSFLTEQEKKYLYWIGKERWQGLGEIVELGSWLGGSTCHLVTGLRENSNFKNNKIQVFDNFNWHNFYDKWLRDQCHANPQIATRIEAFGYFEQPIVENDSFEYLFRFVCTDFLQNIDISKAQLLESPEKTWTGKLVTWDTNKPIEILFIDAAKTWHSLFYLFSVFAKHLIVEKTLLIAQDYLGPYSYWHIIFFEIFSEYFTVEHIVEEGETVTFRLIKPFAFEGNNIFPKTEYEFTFGELSNIFNKVITKWQNNGYSDIAFRMQLAFAVMCHNHKEEKLAQKTIKTLWANWQDKDKIKYCADRYLNIPNFEEWILHD